MFYVWIGTIYLMGELIRSIWREVARANRAFDEEDVHQDPVEHPATDWEIYTA